MGPVRQDLMKGFHAHLDECGLCRAQPHNLCRRGAELLRSAVLDDPRELLRTPPGAAKEGK